MEKISLIYSEELLKRAIKSFWWRIVGPSYILVMLFLAILLSNSIYKGDYSWLMGILISALGMGLLFPSILYINHYRNTIGRFRSLEGKNAIFKADSESFVIESPIGSNKMKWSSVTELWQYQDYWLVFLSKSQFFTLPTSCLTNSIRKTILNNVRAAGGKIAYQGA